MSQQPTSQQRFNLYDAYFREYLTARFHRNIFNLMCLTQVILGSAFMANVASGWVAGLVTTLLSTYILIYRPGEVSSAAQRQVLRYEKVIHRIDRYTSDELAECVINLSEDDSHIPGPLIKPAYIKSDIAINNDSDRTKSMIKELSFCERVFLFIACSSFI